MTQTTGGGASVLRRFSSWSVRSILVLLILLAIIPALGLTLGAGIQARRAALDDARENALRLARLVASREERAIDATRHLLVALSLVPEIRVPSSNICSVILSAVLASYPQYVNLGAARPDGSVSCAARPTASENIAGEAHFARAIGARRFAIGDAADDPVSRTRTLTVAHPVLDPGGRPLAVLFASLKASWLAELAAGASIPRDAGLIVFDAQGRILVAGPRPEMLAGHVRAGAPFMRAVREQPAGGLVEAPGADGVTRLCAFTPLYGDPSNRVYAAVGLSTGEALARAHRLLLFNLLGVGAAALVALGVAWWGGGFLLGRQIEDLARAAARIREGDTSVRVAAPPGHGELSLLAAAFNSMAATVQTRQQEIERANADLRNLSGHLEQRVRERTESLREREARYRELFESANDMVFTMTMQGTLTSINRTGEQLLGYSRDELLGKSFLALLPPDEHETALGRLAAKAAGGGPTVYESALVAKDGRPIAIEVSTKSLLRDGRPAEVLAVARDITERRRAEAQRQREMAERVRLEAELMQSAKMASLGIMAGGIAHEVRNPLSIASAAAQLVLEAPDDDRLRAEALQKIHTSIQRASAIVESLLKFAAPVPGELQPVDVNDIVQETLDLVEHEITQRGIDLQLRLEPGLPGVRASANALEQVFANLILNACQAMERGGRLTVTTGATGSDVAVRVEDTGTGIRPEDLPRIFDPFFTRRPPGAGTGLGLAISYRIVERHRGAIEAFNNDGPGATFVVRLPAADAAPAAPSPAAAPQR
jgi:PAS domain S-box-containing protein